MKTPSRLDVTMRFKIPRKMASRLERVAAALSQKRGLRVGISSVAREGIIAHIEAEEGRHGLTP